MCIPGIAAIGDAFKKAGWIGLVVLGLDCVLEIVRRLIEHIALAWAADKLRDGSGPIIRGLATAAQWCLQHPVEIYIALALTFCVGVIVASVAREYDPQVEGLEFVEWHGGSARSLPKKESGDPTWVSIRNSQIRIPITARNTTVKMEFINDARTSVFTVPEAQWYVEKDLGNDITGRGYKGSVDLEGGEEQSFVLFVTDLQRKIWVYKNGETPVGILDYGHWEINMIVSSNNIEGFEGKIGFTLTRNSLTPDHPAFTRTRTVKPRLRQK